MTVVALDLGTRRIGVAVSDPGDVLATPRGVVERSGDAGADRAAIVALVREVGAERVVVGLPVSLSGEAGRAARAARDEAEALAAELDVPVELADERFTTVVAERALRAGGVKARARRGVVDEAAATVLLQSWLDRAR